MTAVWAKGTLVVADQFRDGTVPASFAPWPVAHAAFAALPATIQAYYDRGDSACHQRAWMAGLGDPARTDGPHGPIGCASSARMSPALGAAIQALSDPAWPPYTLAGEAPDALRDWAEVPFVPREACEQRDTEPLRYLALRVRPRQEERFADGTAVKHFAVLSNLWAWDGAWLLQWHREKAGTIEHVHAVVKNELAGGVWPCGRFGANAAWLRLALLAHNVLTAFTRLALPPARLTARPKRLRFRLFTVPGRLHPCAATLVAAGLPVRGTQTGDHARSASPSGSGRPPPARPDVSALPQGLSSTRSARRRGRVCPARPRAPSMTPLGRPHSLCRTPGVPSPCRAVVSGHSCVRKSIPPTTLRPD